MPRPNRSALSAEELARREMADDLQVAIREIAAELGPAPGTSEASASEELRQWGIRDSKVDHQQMVQRLMTTGYPPEMLDPDGDMTLLVVKENPELAEVYGQPVQDQEYAEQLATIAEWPFRLGILREYEDDPEAMVRKADSLDARWQRSLGPSALTVDLVPGGGREMTNVFQTPPQEVQVTVPFSSPAEPMTPPPAPVAPPADAMMMGG